MPARLRGTGWPARGFTLVELLVVTAVIGMLVALLLPAVQMAREASRRASCASNLRQIGTAIQMYHDAHNGYPPGGESKGRFDKRQQNFSTWTIQILPFLERSDVYELYSQPELNDSRANRIVREQYLSVYSCPSDVHRKTLQRPASGPGWDSKLLYMPGSYRGVGGRSDGTSGCWDGTCNAPTGKRPPLAWRGVFHVVDGNLSSETSASVTDGLSNTLMIGEYCTRPSQTLNLGRRTLWAYSHGSYNRSDVIPQSRTLLNEYDRCAATPGIGGAQPCWRAWGSFHPSVVGFLLCDGSIRHVPLTVDMQCLAASATVAGKEFAPLPR